VVPAPDSQGIRNLLLMDSTLVDNGIMKTTVDIPEDELKDAMRFANAATKREAIVMAIREFNQRRRMAALTRHAGTCTNLITVPELVRARRRP
jgi:Arc/MetJ family transcription regulator